MEAFKAYLSSIPDPLQVKRTEEVFVWVAETFPSLQPKIAWNQPMFTDHGTYIIGFSVSKKHLAVAPEAAGISRFAEEIVQSGYDHTKQLIRIPWNSPVDYSLLEQIIQFNLIDKAGCSTFWRK